MGASEQALRVSLFVTCLVDQSRPSVGLSTVKLLRHLGCHVDFNPRQTCCGQPAFTTGFWKEARTVARHTIEAFEAGEFDWIVIPSGSCAAMFHHYEKLFADDDIWLERAQHIVAKTRELSTFLVDILGIHDVGARFDGKLTWHDACHGLRDLGVREQPRTLLRSVAGAEFVETEKCDACCGFGGVFAANYPEISTSMADVKIDAIQAAGADTVVSGDVGCLMQLDTRAKHRQTKIRFLHLAELLSGSA